MSRPEQGKDRSGVRSTLVIIALEVCGSANFAFGLPFFNAEGSSAYALMERRAKGALEAGQWSEALTVLEEGKRRFWRSVPLRLALAHVYRQVGLLEQARENARWVTQNNPGHKLAAQAWRELAWINYKMYLYEESLASLERVKTRTDGDWALEARIRFERRQWQEGLSALEKINYSIPQTVFWKGWALIHLNRFDEARPLLREAPDPAIARMFAETISTGESDPWVLLGYHVQSHGAHQWAMAAKSKPANMQPREIDADAWEFLEALSRDAGEVIP